MPANRGNEPYCDNPSWPDPALSAPSNWGFHTVPNKNSSIGIRAKNLIDSKATENIMPTVVKIAIMELIARRDITIFSTAFLDLKLWLIFEYPKYPDINDVTMHKIEVIIWDFITHDFHILAALITHAGGVPNINPSTELFICAKAIVKLKSLELIISVGM